MPRPSSNKLGPNARTGRPATGRIVNILFGQGHGYIRVSNAREVYFHRADLQDGTSFNDLQVGDVVRFELLEDHVSGARALRVTKARRTR
jgi:hypothetical protein